MAIVAVDVVGYSRLGSGSVWRPPAAPCTRDLGDAPHPASADNRVGARLIFTENLAPVQWAGVAVVMTGVGVAAARGSVRRVPAAADQATL